MKVAVIFSGIPQNFRYSVASLMKNLLEVNDADAFVLMTYENKRRKTNASNDHMTPEDWPGWINKCNGMINDLEPVNHAEIQYLKNAFGNRLKGLAIAEDIPGYMDYIQKQRENFKEVINKYREESGGVKPFGGDVTYTDNGNLRCVVDQYNHAKKCFELMKEYELTNGRYDYVMRVRLDFICPFEFNVLHHTLNLDKDYMHVCGSFRRDPFEWADEFCWFSKRDLAEKLFMNLDRLGFVGLDRNYTTLHDINDYIFAPETQFSILLKELEIPCSPVAIFRTSQYTYGGDRYDYLNYCFQRSGNIDNEYQVCWVGPSDINEHLPVLKEYASRCDHVTELGTRFGNSTVAFMAAKPKKFITYEVAHNVRLDYLNTFGLVDIRLENPQEIEETDLLFIDTDHHVEQCSKELALHADRVRKYIIFHDVVSFWEKGQGHLSGGGLKYAIEPFISSHPEWKQAARFENNNGLLILERQ